MAISLITGEPGSCKSTFTALRGIEFLKHSEIRLKKTGKVRLLASNMKFCKGVEERYGLEDQGGLIRYWNDPAQVATFKDCDILWEEMGVDCEARNWENLGSELKIFFQQHRHRRCNIVGNIQEFADLDISVRRLTKELLYLTKIIGSPDPYETYKPVTFIWGFIFVLRLDPRSYKEMEKFKNAVPDFPYFLSREDVELYDMYQDIKAGKYPPMKHIELTCSDPHCIYKKTVHK